MDSNRDDGQKIIVKKTNSFLQKNNISNIDLIKIDTEGAEYDILTTIDSETLKNVRWIIGELHGYKDFELLAYLSQWFDIDIDKSIRSRLCNFNARNKQLANIIPWRR